MVDNPFDLIIEILNIMDQKIDRLAEGRALPQSTKKKYAHSIKELADELHWSVSKVMKAKNAGIIPFGQDGRKVIFDLDKVHEAIQTRGIVNGISNNRATHKKTIIR